jgi:hypothetical protein
MFDWRQRPIVEMGARDNGQAVTAKADRFRILSHTLV